MFTRTAVSLMAVATVVAGTGVPAHAAPDADALVDRSAVTPGQTTPGKTLGPARGVSARALAIMTAQVALHRVADRIEAAAATAPEGSGLGGITVDAEHGALDVYWHGRRPAALDKVITSARRSGTTINLIAAPYTLKELEAEVDRLADLHMSGKATAGSVTTLAPKPDATGLTVGISALASGAPATRDAGRMAGLRSTVTSTVPLEFEDAAPAKSDRWLDSPPPYWGGALALRYSSSNAAPENYLGSCSTGFGVTGLNGAATYIMFADHCGAGQWRTGWSQYPDGTIVQRTFGNTITTRDRIHDTQLILTPAGAGSGVYVGESWLGTGQPGRAVTGSARNRNGDYVCTSGSFSGLVCDIRVSGTGMTINITGYGQTEDMVRADHQLLRGAAGNGDSGGPVITTTGDGDTYARGTISAMDTSKFVDCFGVGGAPPEEDGRHCSWRIYYPDITEQLAGVGVRLNTT